MQIMCKWQPRENPGSQQLLSDELVSLVRVSRCVEDMQQAMVALHARLLAGSGSGVVSLRGPAAAKSARGGPFRSLRHQREYSLASRGPSRVCRRQTTT